MGHALPFDINIEIYLSSIVFIYPNLSTFRVDESAKGSASNFRVAGSSIASVLLFFVEFYKYIFVAHVIDFAISNTVVIIGFFNLFTGVIRM